MGLWFLALKARKAANWPRTQYTGLTVEVLSKLCRLFYGKDKEYCIIKSIYSNLNHSFSSI